MTAVFFHPEQIPDPLTKDCIRQLPDWRRAKVERFLFWRDQKLSVLAYLLFLYLCAENGKINLAVGGEELRKLPEWEYGERKKPYIRGCGFRFNISHCGEGVACALSERDVGVDIQGLVTASAGIPELLCTPEEIRFLKQAKDYDRALTWLWTRKEALGKYTGQGLYEGLHKRRCLSDTEGKLAFFTVEIRKNVWVSVCGERREPFYALTTEKMVGFMRHLAG